LDYGLTLFSILQAISFFYCLQNLLLIFNYNIKSDLLMGLQAVHQ